MSHRCGPFVNGRMIQRCMICGYKLVDSDEGATTNFMVGSWIRIEESFNLQFMPDKVPEDNCLGLIE